MLGYHFEKNPTIPTPLLWIIQKFTVYMQFFSDDMQAQPRAMVLNQNYVGLILYACIEKKLCIHLGAFLQSILKEWFDLKSFINH